MMDGPQIIRDVLITNVYVAHPATGKATRPYLIAEMDVATHRIVQASVSLSLPAPRADRAVSYGRPQKMSAIEKWFRVYGLQCEKSFRTYVSREDRSPRFLPVPLPTIREFAEHVEAYVQQYNAQLGREG